MYLNSLRNVVEYKIDHKALGFKTYIKLLDTDLGSCEGENPLCFLSREYGRYINMHLNDENRKLTFNELDVI